MENNVTFYKLKNGAIVAVKNDESFTIPLGSGYGETPESRQTIADNFDSAPKDSVFVDTFAVETTFIQQI